MRGCVFCDIVADRAPVSLVAEEDDLIAFLDINPVNPGHLLVVPRRHVSGMGDLDEDTAAAMMRLAHRLARRYRPARVPATGVNLFLADGVDAGQEVPHVHLHVIPRLPADGLSISIDYGIGLSREQMDELAARLREAPAAD